jgi:hypothetical protein
MLLSRQTLLEASLALLLLVVVPALLVVLFDTLNDLTLVTQRIYTKRSRGNSWMELRLKVSMDLH